MSPTSTKRAKRAAPRRGRSARAAVRQGSAGIDRRRRLCGGARARRVPARAQGRAACRCRGSVMRQELAEDYADLLPALPPEQWRRDPRRAGDHRALRARAGDRDAAGAAGRDRGPGASPRLAGALLPTALSRPTARAAVATRDAAAHSRGAGDPRSDRAARAAAALKRAAGEGRATRAGEPRRGGRRALTRDADDSCPVDPVLSGAEGAGRRHRQRALDRLWLRARVSRARRRPRDHLPQREGEAPRRAARAPARGADLPAARRRDARPARSGVRSRSRSSGAGSTSSCIPSPGRRRTTCRAGSSPARPRASRKRWTSPATRSSAWRGSRRR